MENNNNSKRRILSDTDLYKLSEVMADRLETLPQEEVEIVPGKTVTVYPLNDLMDEILSEEENKETE